MRKLRDFLEVLSESLEDEIFSSLEPDILMNFKLYTYVLFLFVTDTKMVVLSNFLAPEEGVRHEEQETTLYVNDREIGKGTLYITDRYVGQKASKSKLDS